MATEHDGVIMQETAALLANLFPGDIPSIFIPYIVFLVDEKRYADIDTKTISQDFYEMFEFRLDDLVIDRLCREAIAREYIYELSGYYVSNPTKIKTAQFAKEYKRALSRYQDLKTLYGEYVTKEKGLPPLSDEDLDKIILKIIRNVSIDSSEHPSGDAPSVYEMALNDFMLYADKEHPEIVDVVNQLAVSDALWNVVANDHVTQPYFKNGTKIFLDTKCIFRLIGLEGEYWKRVFQSFVEDIKACGGEVVVFDHVMDEINGIICHARKTYKLPNFDIDRSSAVARQFRFENYNDAMIDRILFDLNKNPSLRYDFNIEEHGYEYPTEQYQIDYLKFKQLLVDTYHETNPDFDPDEKGQTLETDIRSITMTYRMRGGAKPHTIQDADCIFVTTNTSLAQAAKKYDRIQHRDNANTVPVCFTANYLSTFIWLGRPKNYIKISRQKMLAYCYAAVRPTKEQIKAYFEQVDLLKRDKSYSADQLQYMRENRSLMRQYTLMSYAAPPGKKPSLLETFDIYKQQSSYHTKILEEKLSIYEDKERDSNQRMEKLQKDAEEYADSRSKWLENRLLTFLPAIIASVIAFISFRFVKSSDVKEILQIVSTLSALVLLALGALVQSKNIQAILRARSIKRYMKKHMDEVLELVPSGPHTGDR